MKSNLLLIVFTSVMVSDWPASALTPDKIRHTEQGFSSPTKNSTQTLEELVASAQSKIKQGEYQSARLDLNKAIDLQPKNALLYVLRGIVYSSLERYERAIQDYDQAIQLQPRNIYFYDLRGDAYSSLQQYDNAISSFSRIIELNPQSTIAYLKRGSLYLSNNLTNKALQDFNQAITLSPQNAETYHLRGQLYAKDFMSRKGESDVSILTSFFSNPAEEVKQKALSDYSQAIKLNPNSGVYYYHRGLLHGAILKSFSGNTFRLFDLGAERQRAINDLQMAAKLFRSNGQEHNYQVAMQAIDELP